MRIVALAFAFLKFSIMTVHADSIDGDWCNEVDGKHLRIDGAAISLDTGVTLQGDYGRHSFSYVEPETGEVVGFVMRSESQMRRVRKPDAMPEHEDLWRRCQPIS
jgi:hypothetical protein